MYYFEDDIKFIIVWQKIYMNNSWLCIFKILAFVISLSNFNIFLFEQ